MDDASANSSANSSANPSASDPFSALSIGALEARILAAVVADEEVLASELAATTGAGPPAISVAVQRLIQCEILERIPGRRPSLIFLHPAAPAALARLRAQDDQAREAQRVLADEAMTLVQGAAQRRLERGRPYYEVEPRMRVDTTLKRWPERSGSKAHWQVLTVADLSGTAPVSKPGCEARVLISGPSTPAWEEVDLARVARRQQPGSEVRITERVLPRVWLLDEERVGTFAGTKQGTRLVWSRDQLHVRAAQELFALWWDATPAGVVAPDKPAWTDRDLDVDEWEPADLPYPVRD